MSAFTARLRAQHAAIVASYTEGDGRTVREVMEHLGIKSAGTVHRHLTVAGVSRRKGRPSIQALRQLTPADLGCEVPAVGLCDFDHVASMYEPTATIIRKQADERRRQSKKGKGK